jgi:hypothetical protein
MREPRILEIDIETAPAKAWVWGIYDQNPSYDQMLIDEWYVLCWSAKWLNSSKMYSSALPDFKAEYKKNPKNDFFVLREMWDLLNEADIVIAHNGDKFDIRKLQARFVYHGMEPYAPFKSIDTLKVARKHFKFTSNRLDHLGIFLGLGRKESTGGFKLWKDICENQCPKAWKKMISYNKQDVLLLEKVYIKLRPWMSNHPNLAVMSEAKELTCPQCMGTKFHSRGFDYGASKKRRRYKCVSTEGCGGWAYGKAEPTVGETLKVTGRR